MNSLSLAEIRALLQSVPNLTPRQLENRVIVARLFTLTAEELREMTRVAPSLADA